MDTDNLRLFVLAAERLNISAAGRALGMTPAAASTRLAPSEERECIDFQLFDIPARIGNCGALVHAARRGM